MKRYAYNTIVIGAGSAGLVASYLTAALKAKVLLIEQHKMGGDCLNTGCVPSKALLSSAKILSYTHRAHEFGFNTTTIDYDFAKVMERVQQVITTIAPHDSVERYTRLGVECLHGSAKIVAPHHVDVNGKIYTARSIIVATGARPFVPPIIGIDQIDYLTSDTIWNLRERPRKLLVLGGGPIGVEMAQAFARLGSEVTIVEMAQHILTREDNEAIQLITQHLHNENIKILSNHQAKSFLKDGDKKILTCAHQGQEVSMTFDKVLVALGRQAHVTGFGLEELGVKLNPRKTVAANSLLATNVPSIYVCGDVTGPYQFTHMAAHQAWYASINALFNPFKKFRINYRVVPWAIFTDPEIARVGLNEKEAIAQQIPYEVTFYNLNDLDRAITDSTAHGFIKILTKPGKDKILGVTIVSAHASDIIAEFILAMRYNLGLNKILATIHIYPTMGEAVKHASGQWRKNRIPKFALKILEKFHLWRRT